MIFSIYLYKNIFVFEYQIVVTYLNQPKTKYVASCNKWLAKNEGDGQISRDLVLRRDADRGRPSKNKQL
jgi:hypothetical protein